MTYKSLNITLLLCFSIVFLSYAQTNDQKTSKQEERFHDKENSRFVNDVESLQREIQRIREDKSLSSAEQNAKIKPIYERMQELRTQNVNARHLGNENSSKDKSSRFRNDDLADKTPKRKSKKARKNKKQQEKRIKKEIKQVKKDKGLTEAERVSKLEMLRKELKNIKSGKDAMASTVIRRPRVDNNSSDMATKKLEREKQMAEKEAKRKNKMESGLQKQKEARDVARAKREKNIEQWKAKARKESGQATDVQSDVTVDGSAEKRAKDKWMTDNKAKQQDKIEKDQGKRKEAKDMARVNREKNIKEWKAKAAKEKTGTVSSSPAATQVAQAKPPMTKAATVTKPDQMTAVNQTDTQKKARSSHKEKTLERLTRMSTRLSNLKNDGLINETHFEKKMAHIRAFREKMMRP